MTGDCRDGTPFPPNSRLTLGAGLCPVQSILASELLLTCKVCLRSNAEGWDAMEMDHAGRPTTFGLV